MANVYDRLSLRIGRVEGDGRIFTSANQFIGFTEFDGRVNDPFGAQLGLVDWQGYLYNAPNQVIGYVAANGTISDARNRYAGHVSSGVPLQLMGGAALLLIPLLRP